MVGHLPEIWLSVFHWSGLAILLLSAILFGLMVYESKDLSYMPAGISLLLMIICVLLPFVGIGLLIMAHSTFLIPSVILAMGVALGILSPILLFVPLLDDQFFLCGVGSMICLLVGDLLALGAWLV